MRKLPNNFQEHLDAKCTTLCFCLAIKREDGIVIGFTDHDRTLAFEGIEFSSQNGCELSSINSTNDTSADEAEVIAALQSDALRSEDVLNGKYENAELSIWRVNWQNVEERVLLKFGFMGEITKTANSLQISFQGLTAKLDQTIGRLYQQTCDACLGDARCKVDLTKTNFTVSSTITEKNSDTVITLEVSQLFPENWFSNGVLEFLDDAQRKIKRNIIRTQLKNAKTKVIVDEKLPSYPLVGGAVSLTVGCDKAAHTCRSKFSNFLNFRGFPHMPGDDFVLRLPTTGEVNDGGKR